MERPMKVWELPSMLVLKMENDADGLIVHGRFDRLNGVGASGWFWPGPDRYVFGELTQVDRSTCVVVFRPANDRFASDNESEARGLSVGDRLPWFDDRFQVPIVQAIIDESHVWRRVNYEARDATYFRLRNAVGWQETGGKLPDGAVETGVTPEGWDHEHCTFCRESIHAGGPPGYADSEELWLCSAC